MRYVYKDLSIILMSHHRIESLKSLRMVTGTTGKKYSLFIPVICFQKMEKFKIIPNKKKIKYVFEI